MGGEGGGEVDGRKKKREGRWDIRSSQRLGRDLVSCAPTKQAEGLVEKLHEILVIYIYLTSLILFLFLFSFLFRDNEMIHTNI